VSLSIERSGDSDDAARDERDVLRARRLVLRYEQRMGSILAAITPKLLPIYNKRWRDDRPALQSAAFLRKLRLSSAVIHPDGSATLHFSNGGLFLDHAIEAQLGRHGEVKSVSLA
jgi:hypothetical protein